MIVFLTEIYKNVSYHHVFNASMLYFIQTSSNFIFYDISTKHILRIMTKSLKAVPVFFFSFISNLFSLDINLAKNGDI